MWWPDQQHSSFADGKNTRFVTDIWRWHVCARRIRWSIGHVKKDAVASLVA
jgi:hypothetical protein